MAALALVFSLTFVPRLVAALLSRRVALARGAGELKAFDDDGRLQTEIVKLVRRREWAPDTAFDAESTLRSIGIAFPVLGLTCVVLLSGFVALWWPHGRALDTVYSDNGIETGEFWSMKRTVYPYETVSAVRLKCRIFDNDDTEIGYDIQLPEKMERKLVVPLTLTDQLDDSLIVDKKLRNAGAKFVFALHEEMFSRADTVDRACVLQLARGDAVTRAKLEQLFHIDEWFERRWLLRTGKLYIAGS